jgi:hypothetical protein
LDTDKGRPLGISRARALSRRDSRLDEEECEECLLDLDEDELDFEELDLDDEDLLEEEEEEEDFSMGTSRMLSTRPVVGSVVEAIAGSWETWYPSMI